LDINHLSLQTYRCGSFRSSGFWVPFFFAIRRVDTEKVHMVQDGELRIWTAFSTDHGMCELIQAGATVNDARLATRTEGKIVKNQRPYQ
jgi:hypothetical protein